MKPYKHLKKDGPITEVDPDRIVVDRTALNPHLPERPVVVGYIRVSSEEQAESGLSLEHQRDRIASYCVAMDLTLMTIVEDAGKSGKDLKRPGIAAIFELMDADSIDGVVVLKLDRLTRSVRDLGDIIERFDRQEVALIAVQESINTGTAAGRLIANVMASIAQWEREVTGERTKAALAVRKKQGFILGKARYGYELIDGKERVKLREQEAVIAMVDLYNGGMGWQAIADWANQYGVRTKAGKLWHHGSVKRIVLYACEKFGLPIRKKEERQDEDPDA